MIGFEEEIIAAFDRVCSKLFYAGRFAIILFFADNFLKRGLLLNHNIYLDISKTYSVYERFEEALQLLEDAKKLYEARSIITPGHLYLATALVLKRLNKVEESIAELFLARETFIWENDHDAIAQTENSLGNIYFSMGHPRSARSHYQAGIYHAKICGNQTLLPSFLTNTGLVEYDLGNFVKAKQLLSRAYSLYIMQNNFWSASVTGMGLGKIYMKLGYYFKALKVFKEVLKIREEKKNLSGIYEINSLIAWICELLGKNATAQTHWNQAKTIINASKIESRALYVGESLNAMTLLFNHRFDEAEKKYKQLLAKAQNENFSGSRLSDCEHGIASVFIFSGKENKSLNHLQNAMKYICNDNSRLQMIQIQIMAGLFFPEHFCRINLSKLLKKFLESKAFDPFWGLLAKKIFDSGKDKKNRYLRYHISRTPPTMLKHMIETIPDLKKIITEINQVSRAGEFFNYISKTETRTLHYDEYQEWKKNLPANTLIFDAPTGDISFNENKTKVKPGSIPHIVLLQLFMAQPHQIEIASLYKSAWGTQFDPEYDLGAFKTTIQRIKLLLNTISPTTRITRKTTNDQLDSIKLSIYIPWIVIFK